MFSFIINAFFPSLGELRDKIFLRVALFLSTTWIPIIIFIFLAALIADWIGLRIPPAGLGNPVDSIIFILLFGATYLWFVRWVSAKNRIKFLIKLNVVLSPLILFAAFFFDNEIPEGEKVYASIFAALFGALFFIIIGYIYYRYLDDPDANSRTLGYPMAKKLVKEGKYKAGFAILESYAKRDKHRLSLIDLGNAFATGEGKPKDNMKAAIYYYRASHTDYTPAQDILREHLKLLTAEEIIEFEREKLLF